MMRDFRIELLGQSVNLIDVPLELMQNLSLDDLRKLDGEVGKHIEKN